MFVQTFADVKYVLHQYVHNNMWVYLPTCKIFDSNHFYVAVCNPLIRYLTDCYKYFIMVTKRN